MKNTLTNIFLFAIFMALPGVGLAESTGLDKELKSKVKKSIDHGLRHLQAAQTDGTWLKHPGMTSLCLLAFTTCPRGYIYDDGPFMRGPIDYLLKNQQSDGSIYDPQSMTPTKNYCTSLAILALASLKDKRFTENIKKAQSYLVKIQADEGENYQKDTDYFYGGIGYGGDLRPDLSNLHLALDALRTSGYDKNSPVFKKALIFLDRCQDTESNEMEWAKGSGGFAYSPDLPTNKNLPNKKEKDRMIVPYGSMTFAGLKSLIFCNVTKDDARVQAALAWVKRNFSVKEHPGMGQISVYYYYYTLARTLHVLGIKELKLEDGSVMNWRKSLAKELLGRQSVNGSWVNEEKKYMEGLPVLATAYAINALNIAYHSAD
ncbi:MAG: terpene cyclase/mutase family protein [Planctomycetes bacterium]|nr:terpene cyclase/mutase family protein [Planctomycetota bacterium]